MVTGHFGSPKGSQEAKIPSPLKHGMASEMGQPPLLGQLPALQLVGVFGSSLELLWGGEALLYPGLVPHK